MPRSLQPAGDGPGSPRQPGRAERLEAALDRDGTTCVWCGRTLGALVAATTEHVVPRVKGGPSWQENEVAACRRCNSQRGHLGPVDWLDECRRRGWQPDAGRLVASLLSLSEAIERRGGQRRARPYLASQLRRLERRGHLAAGEGGQRPQVRARNRDGRPRERGTDRRDGGAQPEGVAADPPSAAASRSSATRSRS